MRSRDAVLVAAVVVALISGFLAGQTRTPGETDPGRAGPEPAGVDLTQAVEDPPDASWLDRRTTAGQDAALAATGATPLPVGHLLACEPAATGPRLCEHGSEDPPAGVDPTRLPTVAQLKARQLGGAPAVGAVGGDDVVTPEEVASAGRVPCIGNGSSGPRVQAVYAHASDVPNRYTAVLPLIERYAADVSTRLNQAAGRSGQGRAVRYVTSGSPCVLDVANVTLSRTGNDTFANSVAELRLRGFHRSDRKYLVWMDAAVGICGIAHLYPDDRATLDNANTSGNMFARTDAPCWGYAELHELLHTLGAVQASAPNATLAGHCHDNNDTMCYEDLPGTKVHQACPHASALHVDCNLDDYFDAAPAPGSYLATRWNAARNPYLQVVEAPPTPPALTISSATRAFAGNAWKVAARPDLPSGTTAASFRWTSSRPDCRFVRPRRLTTYYWCPVTAAGRGRVQAWLRDSQGNEVSRDRDYRLVVPAAARRTRLALASSTSRITAGQRTRLRARLTDPATTKPVIGMPVSLYRRPAGASSWAKIATKRTSPQGRAAFAVRPGRTTDYQVLSGRTSTWATGSSPTRRIAVRR